MAVPPKETEYEKDNRAYFMAIWCFLDPEICAHAQRAYGQNMDKR